MGVLASHQYSDVPDSNFYHGDIDAITDAGVTTGCGGGKYCPSAFVTREQMAAFLNRLGALGPGKTPVTNATTVDFWDANELTRAAYNSTNFLLDGDVASSASLTVNITAPAPGWLLINGHGEVYNEGDPDQQTMSCRLEVNNGVVPGTTTSIDTQYTGGGAVDLDQTECNATGGYEVCGGVHAVEYAVLSVDAEENVFDAGVTVQYVPFNGVGNAKPFFPDCFIIIPLDEQVEAPAKE
jgi:hypothetical protein